MALFDNLYIRLLGICFASFSSGTPLKLGIRRQNIDSIMILLLGLGELTFLQLSTTYAPSTIAGYSVGYVTPSFQIIEIDCFGSRYFASGTGAAGLVGAFLWWVVRGLGVRIGVGMSSVTTTRH